MLNGEQRFRVRVPNAPGLHCTTQCLTQEYLNLVDWKGLELPSTERRCKASVKKFERSPTVLAEWIELKKPSKITPVFMYCWTQRYMSYVALYDIQYFNKLFTHVILSKAYPTYICSLKDICFEEHILFNSILCYTTYMAYTTTCSTTYIYVHQKHIYVIEFYKTHICNVSLNNIYVILR